MRIVVLGAGGMLGHKIYEVLSKNFEETFAAFRKCPAHYSSFGLFDQHHMRGAFDARKTEDIHAFLKPLKPDVVINCIGLTTRKISDQNESDIIVVNSVLPHKLKEWCQKNGSQLIHFSTDCVFSGKDGPYRLGDPRDAKDLYGQSKAIGEVDGPSAFTIRSSIIGLELEGKTELLEWLIAQRGKHIQGFANVLYSGVTTTTMAHVVLELIKKLDNKKIHFSGIAQLASPPISKFDLLNLANQVFSLNCSIKRIDQPRSNKILIQSDFFNESGIHAPSWGEQLNAVASELHKYERWFAHGGQNSKRKAS